MTEQDVQDELRRMLFVVLSQQTPPNDLVTEVYDYLAKGGQLGRFGNKKSDELLNHQQTSAN